jgi:serine protease AprX
MTLNRPSFVPTAVQCAVALAVSLVCAVGAEAGHRAKLSRDLADRVAAGRSETVRLIVSGTEAEVNALAERHGARVAKRLRGAAVLEVSGNALDAMAQDPAVAHLSGDVPVRRLMAVTTEAIGANQVWRGALAGLEGQTGAGIGVAVIDSGIASHEALRNRVVASVDFTGRNGTGRDQYGHGTHVAGIIAGLPESGYAGVAPGAHLVNLQVLNPDGSGETSDVIAAIDWAVEHRAQYQLRVINLSLGHPVFESYREDPLCQAVQRAVDAGMVVVTAAGNFGKTEDGKAIIGGIVSPGNSPAALTVGASNARGTAQRSDDVMATYSSRGRRVAR